MGAFIDRNGRRHEYETKVEQQVARLLSGHNVPPLDFNLIEALPDSRGFFLRCRQERSFFKIESNWRQRQLEAVRDFAMSNETNYRAKH